MARVAYGENVGQVSGSVGNTKHSRGRYGSFVSVRRPPCRRSTEFTEGQKSVFAEVVHLWRGLSDEERASWVTWAQSNPIRDRLGQDVVLSGYGVFCELNMRLLSRQFGTISVPPTVPAPSGVYLANLTATAAIHSVEFTWTKQWDVGVDWMTGWVGVVTGSRRRRPLDVLKYMGMCDGIMGIPLEVGTAVEERFGTLIVGQTLLGKVQLLSSLTGLYGPPEYKEIVVG